MFDGDTVYFALRVNSGWWLTLPTLVVVGAMVSGSSCGRRSWTMTSRLVIFCCVLFLKRTAIQTRTPVYKYIQKKCLPNNPCVTRKCILISRTEIQIEWLNFWNIFSNYSNLIIWSRVACIFMKSYAEINYSKMMTV